MDILYVFKGQGSTEELRYSLRSIAKNGIGIDNVFLVGTKPEWCSDKVIEIKHTPKYTDKEKNITDAILTVCNSEIKIADHFLISSDDHFYIKPTDFNNYPFYLKGLLPEKYSGNENMGDEKYVKSLINTKAILMSAGLSQANFCQHANTHVKKRLVREFYNVFRASLLIPLGASFQSIMGNIIFVKTAMVPKKRKDNKIRMCTSINNLKLQIGDTEVFSTYDSAMNNGAREVLQQMFPEKSIYEK